MDAAAGAPEPGPDSSEFEFDAETRLAGGAGPSFTAQITDRWSGLAGVNGGFMLALCTRALSLSTTVQLTVHLRARPVPGWLACRALTRHVAGGYHEEDFEIWNRAGTLVAQSRQLALVLG